VLERARGMLVVLRNLHEQRRIPYLSPEEVGGLRDQRLQAVVRHASAHVPHYRELFRRERIDPREIRSVDDLAALPLLDRTTVQRDPERFRADSDVGEVLEFRTAGSTAEPVTLYRDRRAMLENLAHTERERVVEALLCGRRYGYRVATIAPPAGNYSRVRAFYGRATYRPLRPREERLSVADAPEAIVRELNRIRPRVLRGLGSALELLFRTAAAGRWSIARPRVVVYAGDGMTAEGRHLIEHDFGIPVISRYGSAEAPRIGFTCEVRNGFHLHEDLCPISIVDADGKPASPGTSGEVVVSDLVNRAMVLLNYRLGDLGRVRAGGCACGRTSRLLSGLDGRVEAFLTLADGSHVHPLLAEQTVRQHDEVLRFQIVQRERDLFELKLVTADQAAYDRIVPELVAELRRLLHGATVVAERCEELSASQAGKFRPVVPLGRAAALT
jgi:phenylacetate-CoA ligase